MEEHLVSEHDKALFFCSLCDSDTKDPNIKSDLFDNVAEHVRSAHNVTEQEGINFSIKIPFVEYLRKYKCMLCQKQFIATTEEKLIRGHFKSVHNTKNVKPRQIKRICRICSWDKSTTDAELIKHINESHPPDNFADDDDEDEAASASAGGVADEDNEQIKEGALRLDDEEEEEEVKLEIKPPQVVVIAEKKTKLEDGECTPDAGKAGNKSSQLTASPLANGVNGINSRKRKQQNAIKARSSSSSSDDSSSSVDSSSSTSSSEEETKKQRRKKRKKAKKKHKKKHKRKKRTTVIMKYQSDDNATEDEEEDEEDDDEDEDEVAVVALPSATKKQKQLAEQIINVDSLDDEVEEERKIVVKPLKLTESPAKTRVAEDISLFNKLRGPRNESSEEGELRDSPAVDKRKARILEQIKTPVIRMKSLTLEQREDSNSTWKEEEEKYEKEDTREDRAKSAASSSDHLRRSAVHNSASSSSSSVVKSRPSLLDFFCDECKLPIREDEAFDHYSGSLHRYNTKNKIRCYLCNRYTENTKDHLERNHFKDIFQCKLQCSNPKFLDLVKILNHMDDKHSNMIRGKSSDELFRRNMISMPQSLASYRCKICNRQFVGQSEAAVMLHQKREDGIRNSTFRDIIYFCRICGGKKTFDDDRDLKDHIKSHLDYKNKAPSRSRSRTPRSRSPRERRKYRDSSDSSSRRSRDRRSRERSRRHSRSSSSSKSRSRSPLAPPPSVSARKRRYVRCVYCPQVTEPLEEDIKSHQMTHRDVFFKCQQCRERFQAANVKDIFEHLVTFHKKRDDDPEYLLKHYTLIPSDLRRIYCVTCYKDASDTSKVPEWCCQTLSELKSTLVEHMEEKHGRKQTFGETFRLGCRACKEYFDAEFEEDQWRSHVRKGHEYKTSSSSAVETRRASTSSHRRSSRASSSSSSSNSSSDSSSSSDSDDDRKERSKQKSGSDRRSSVDDKDAKPKLRCNYCYEAVGETETMLGIHIRDKHSEFVFRCTICPEGTKEFFHDEPSTYSHMVKQHKSDAKFKSWRSHISSPKDLRCIKCQLCASAYFYAKGGVDIEAFKKGHFAIKHSDSSFHQGHLDFLCRICMRPGENDDEEELKDHLIEQHPEIKKEKPEVLPASAAAKPQSSPVSEYGTPIIKVKAEFAAPADREVELNKPLDKVPEKEVVKKDQDLEEEHAKKETVAILPKIAKTPTPPSPSVLAKEKGTSSPTPVTVPSPGPDTAAAATAPKPKAVPTPVSAAVPKPKPVPAASPKPKPIPAATPKPKPVPAAAPNPKPVPAATANPKPVPAAALKPKPVPAAAPKPKPVPAAVPKPKPVPVAAPKPKPVQAAAPKPKPVPAAAPKPKPVPAAVSPQTIEAAPTTVVTGKAGSKIKITLSASKASPKTPAAAAATAVPKLAPAPPVISKVTEAPETTPAETSDSTAAKANGSPKEKAVPTTTPAANPVVKPNPAKPNPAAVDAGVVVPDMKKKFLSPPIGTRITYCYFCPKSPLGFEGPKHILDAHFAQCYECKLCDKMVSVDIETLQKHLKSEHKFEPMFNRPRMLESVRFPRDPRHMKCLKCSVIFLGQDVDKALEHLSRKHNVSEAELANHGGNNNLVMSCRHCCARVDSAAHFEAHAKTCFVTADKTPPPALGI